MTEERRRAAAFTGIALWFAYPFAFVAQSHANWEYQCGGRTFTGSFDGCFNDGLPVFEVGAIILTIALAYPFARLSFSMFGPAADARSVKWRLAAKSGGADYHLFFQIAAGAGILWAGWHLLAMPFAVRYWYLISYWFIWIGWFVLGVFASFPITKHDATNGS